ncbi:MAG TPA: hypothetical protein VF323_11110 [Candidatus Limnocylindrales bacterium]
MDDIKKAGREIETGTKKRVRDVDGHDIGDDIGNAGDEIRKDLGNAGDHIRTEVGKVRDEARHPDQPARSPR